MDNVGGVIKTIIGITFMWSIGENLLPKNNFQKYSDYVYGLIIISIILTLIINFQGTDFRYLYDNLINISEYNSDYLKKTYEDNLEKILKEKFNDDSVKVELTDEYNVKKITCKDKKTYDDIMGYLNGE